MRVQNITTIKLKKKKKPIRISNLNKYYVDIQYNTTHLH